MQKMLRISYTKIFALTQAKSLATLCGFIAKWILNDNLNADFILTIVINMISFLT